jgi:S1-C subfamily serine protease
MNVSSEGGVLAALSDDLAGAAETVGRSVVAIHARRRIPASGVVWRDGVIAAAHHTVQRDEDITVTLHDGSSVAARLAGRDPSTDLAVLRLDGTAAQAPPIRMADEAPRPGHLVLALGRPGRGLTASLGVVSAVGGEWRTWQGGTIDRFIRLDLAIHDGFSGGPLVGASGQVLGLNTSGLSRAMALTIPAGTVTRVVAQLLEQGRVTRGWLGIATQPVQLPAALQKEHGIGAIGMVIVNVAPGSPAERGGLMLGDILIAVNDRAVDRPGDVLAAVAGEKVGTALKARVVRGGRLETVVVTVGERPDGRR